MHLSAEQALDLIEMRASEDRFRFWMDHLAGCSDCSTQFQDWQRIHALLKRQNLESAPASVIATARAILEPPADRRSLREVVASLVFDSFAQAALAGARGTTPSRQLLLSAADVDVHLRMWIDGVERRIAGQILSRDKTADLTGTLLHLLHEGKQIGTVEVDKFGEFEFEEVPNGPLSLQIELPHLKITSAVIPD